MPYLKGKRYTRDLKYDFKRLKEKEKNVSKKTQRIDAFIYSFFIVFLFYIVFTLFFGDRNLKNLTSKEKELANLKEKEAKLLKIENNLRNEIQNLKEDRYYIEKIAREDLGLMKDNEVIYIIPEKDEKEEKIENNTENRERWINRIIKKMGLKD